jgi:hypothetical protein
MLVLFFFMYILSIIFVCYDKYCTVLDVHLKPQLYLKPPLVITFSILRIALRYGSIVGIYFYLGIYAAVICWIVSYLFSTYSLRLYYKRRVKYWRDVYVKVIIEDNKKECKEQSDHETIVEAMRLAEKTVQCAMKCEVM